MKESNYKSRIFQRGDMAILDEDSIKALVEIQSMTQNGMVATIQVSGSKGTREVPVSRLSTYSRIKHGTTDKD